MASPAAGDLPNGISTPPTTAPGAQNPSPPTASSTQAQPQSQSQPATQSTSQTLTNGAPNPAAHGSYPSTSLQDNGLSKRPRDARLIHLLLANMGVTAYTERVPLQLLDFAYRYTQGILSDAIAYEPAAAAATGKKSAARNDDESVSLPAVRTAVAARAQHQFNPALPKEFLMDLANERNRTALPRVEREFGVRLPPERYCFTGLGWDVREEWESEGEVEQEEDVGMVGGPVGGDTAMGGMEDEVVEEDEFEEVMGVGGRDVDMADG